MNDPAPRPLGSRPSGYCLRLFVAGNTPRSQRAIGNLRRLCDEHLGAVVVEIIDIYQQPELAVQDQVVAAPTLVKLAPLPLRRIIGELADEQRVLRAFDLPTRPDAH